MDKITHPFVAMKMDPLGEVCTCGYLLSMHASEQPAASAAREDMAQDSGSFDLGAEVQMQTAMHRLLFPALYGGADDGE